MTFHDSIVSFVLSSIVAYHLFYIYLRFNITLKYLTSFFLIYNFKNTISLSLSLDILMKKRTPCFCLIIFYIIKYLRYFSNHNILLDFTFLLFGHKVLRNRLLRIRRNDSSLHQTFRFILVSGHFFLVSLTKYLLLTAIFDEQSKCIRVNHNLCALTSLIGKKCTCRTRLIDQTN